MYFVWVLYYDMEKRQKKRARTSCELSEWCILLDWKKPPSVTRKDGEKYSFLFFPVAIVHNK